MKNFFITTALLASATIASTINIDPNATAQKIVGFGGASVYYQNWIAELPEADKEVLFDTAFTGLNLSILRIANWLQDETKDISEDVTIVKAAQQRLGDRLKIEMSSWSAPGTLKPSGSVNGSAGNGNKANNTLKKANGDKYGSYAYTDFAAWWKKSLESYKAAGIVPDYISLQNEPDMDASYEETLFEPTETQEIAGYKEALNAVYDVLEGTTKIIGPEPLGIGYGNFEKYASVLDDNKLDGYAYHLYHAGDQNDNSGENYLNPENFRKSMTSIANVYGKNNKPIFMTEFCPMLDAPREEDMVGLAHIMQIGFTDGKLSGYIAWQLFYGYHAQFIGVCPGAGWDLTGEGKYVCTNKEIKIFPEYHAMRHYSKFTNPGWSVISTTTEDVNLKTVAFKSEDNDSISVVIINTSKNDISLDKPIINDLDIITAVQSKENGDKSKEFSVSESIGLPARSITTLVYVKKDTPGTTNINITNKLEITNNLSQTQIFDMNGSLIWKGLKKDALNENGTIKPKLRKGFYILKTKSTTVKAVKN